ncbi:hypothetical protein D3C81_1846120 [compost metagenome]
MLDGAIPVQQQWTAYTNIWTQGIFDQTLQPIALDDLGIVIEEHQHLAMCLRGGQVVQSRPIEWNIGIDNPEVTTARHVLQPRQGLWLGGTVVDHNDFIGRIVGHGLQRLNTGT